MAPSDCEPLSLTCKLEKYPDKFHPILFLTRSADNRSPDIQMPRHPAQLTLLQKLNFAASCTCRGGIALTICPNPALLMFPFTDAAPKNCP